jgi:hypothetical protein
MPLSFELGKYIDERFCFEKIRSCCVKIKEVDRPAAVAKFDCCGDDVLLFDPDP